MSDDTAASPENSAKPAVKTAPRVRRISTPRPKKVAKSAAADEAPAAAEPASIPFPKSPNPEREMPREMPTDAATPASTDWPEPEAASNGGSLGQAEPNKRKRRRRKGKGQNSAPTLTDVQSGEEVPTQNASDGKSPEAAPEPRPRPQQPQSPRAKVDPEILNKMAWKIYLAEVSEEGVALIGDNDAKDLSRRCFRLAEIFIEEQSRHR